MTGNYFQLIGLVMVALLLPAPVQADRKSEAKIGLLVSLSGDAAADGHKWLEGARLAGEDLSAEGQNVQLVVEDDGTVPGKAAAGFLKLVRIDKVQGVIGGTWDFLAETVYPLAAQQRIPFVAPTNPIEIVSAPARTNPWVFVSGLSLHAEEGEIRAFLREKSPASLALSYINVPYGTLHAELVKRLCRELNIPVVADTEINYQSFADSIRFGALKAVERKAELVFLVTNYEGVDLFMRELERLQARPLVLLTHCLKEAIQFGKVRARYARAYGIVQKFDDPAFTGRFKQKYGRTPDDYAAAGYDAVRFLAAALLAKIDLSRPAPDFTYAGVTGTFRLTGASREVLESGAKIVNASEAAGEL